MSQPSVTTYCPACGKTFHVPAELTGKKVMCKGCGTHFLVQADKPGLPVASPAKAAGAEAHAPAAPAKAAAPSPKAAAPPPPAAKTSAPPPPPPAPAATAPDDGLASIPLDDSPIALSDGTTASQMISAAAPALGQSTDKVKFESKGHYFVVKLHLTGKMIHVGIEKALNEHAADGWRLQSVVNAGEEALAILYREPSEQKPALEEAKRE